MKPTAFESRVAPHRSRLTAYAMRYTRDPADAADLVQDSLVRAWRAWEALEEGADVGAWLHVILRNTFFNICGARKRYAKRLAEVGEQEKVFRGGEQITRESISPHLRAAIEQLPETWQRMVIGFTMHEKTYKELAAELGVPVGTVMSGLARARERLRATVDAAA